MEEVNMRWRKLKPYLTMLVADPQRGDGDEQCDSDGQYGGSKNETKKSSKPIFNLLVLVNGSDECVVASAPSVLVGSSIDDELAILLLVNCEPSQKVPLDRLSNELVLEGRKKKKKKEEKLSINPLVERDNDHLLVLSPTITEKEEALKEAIDMALENELGKPLLQVSLSVESGSSRLEMDSMNVDLVKKQETVNMRIIDNMDIRDKMRSVEMNQFQNAATATPSNIEGIKAFSYKDTLLGFNGMANGDAHMEEDNFLQNYEDVPWDLPEPSQDTKELMKVYPVVPFTMEEW